MTALAVADAADALFEAQTVGCTYPGCTDRIPAIFSCTPRAGDDLLDVTLAADPAAWREHLRTAHRPTVVERRVPA